MTVPLPRRHLFGLDFVDLPSLAPVVEVLLARPAGPVGPGAPLPVVVTPNVDQLVRLHRGVDAVADAVIHRAEYVLPDGQPIVWASRLLGQRLGGRLPGSALVPALWERILDEGRRALVVASSATVADRVVTDGGTALVAPMLSLTDRPGIDSFADECVAAIRGSDPDYVFVTLGFPKQCNVIDAILRRLGASETTPMMLAVGASFDMHYGLVRRAPEWVQRAGFEWLFRFAQEPRRLFRRYFVDDPAFVRLVWRERRRSATP